MNKYVDIGNSIAFFVDALDGTANATMRCVESDACGHSTIEHGRLSFQAGYLMGTANRLRHERGGEEDPQGIPFPVNFMVTDMDGKHVAFVVQCPVCSVYVDSGHTYTEHYQSLHAKEAM